MKKIILFSGPIHSGKTTRLQKFIADKNCDGIVAPVNDGKRYIQRIKTGEIKPLETENEDAIVIGKYKFSKETMEWARQQIQESLQSNIDYLVIDEVGKLEMVDQGYEPMVNFVVDKFKKENLFDLILVVRESLVDQVIEKYKLKDCNYEFAD
ncbi:MAG: nucleoside-triphosphatase [Melioribacteraceae bacterium]|nr:nucleoside-triphosphatase [Melioribacteraceae bacterium]